MSDLALFFTLIFILVTLVLSQWQKLGLEKDIVIGTIRAAIQLIAVGYVLHFIFAAKSWIFLALMISIMIVVATFNAAGKWRSLRGIHLRIGIALAISEILTMGLIIGLGIIEPTAQYIIPISGMIIGNSMMASGLFLNRLKGEMDSKIEEIKIYLSLGATSKQAAREVKSTTVKASMIPSIDAMKTVGLVQLPGMMTGMIIAGASPIAAVRYQLLIMYSLTSSAAVTAIILAILSHSLLFNQSHQLIGINRLKQ